MDLKRRTGLILVLVASLSSMFVEPVWGDGGIVIYDGDMSLWELQGMDRQTCAINYEDGFENMLLSVDISDLRGEKAVWIFPIPAEPSGTSIDIIKGFPRFGGYDMERQADETVADAFLWMRLSQVYTIPYMMLMTTMQLVPPDLGVEVHEHVEEMGLTTELITAEDGTAFYEYLTDTGLDLPPDLRSVLEEYVGKEYSFVASWISDIERFRQETAGEDIYGPIINTAGVSIRFRTDSIYFPLRPTSVYGSSTIPMLIYVMGHVTPELYPEIERESRVNYYLQGHYDVPGELSSFFGGRRAIEDLRYTRIRISAPSHALTEDLWIDDSAPVGLAVADFVNRYAWIGTTIFFALSSCLASLFAGTIAFRRGRTLKTRLALLGLFNFLSLVGFVVACAFLADRTVRSGSGPEPRLRAGWDSRKSLFTLLFTVFFLILTFVLQTGLQSVL
jgi:hypothetical protein